jgi:hypothetical protein
LKLEEVLGNHDLFTVPGSGTSNDAVVNREEHEFQSVGDVELAQYHNDATINRIPTKGKATCHIFVRISSHNQLNHSVLRTGKGELLACWLTAGTGPARHSLQVSGFRPCQRRPVFGSRTPRGWMFSVPIAEANWDAA